MFPALEVGQSYLRCGWYSGKKRGNRARKGHDRMEGLSYWNTIVGGAE